MKYAVIAVAGAIAMGLCVLADALEARHNYSHANDFATLGCVTMLIGVLGVILPTLKAWRKGIK